MTALIELVFFEGCPHTNEARRHLSEALSEHGLPHEWVEWNLSDEGTPDAYRRFGSPTVLVDGSDVTGDGPGTNAMACRASGAPGVDEIDRFLTGPEGSSI